MEGEGLDSTVAAGPTQDVLSVAGKVHGGLKFFDQGGGT